MSRKRIAEKSRAVRKSVKEGNAKVTYKPDGKMEIKKAAPNVDKKKVRRCFYGTRIFYNCPKCGQVITFRKKMHRNLCMNCGQYLDWADYENRACVWIQVENAEDAGYWASEYESATSTLYRIDFEAWRLSMTKKRYPMLLFFPFPEGKAYGRFMRKAAKEADIVKDVNYGQL